MYKYIQILFPDLNETIVNEDMICKKYNLNKQNFKAALDELKKHGYIIEYKIQKTNNHELYAAILTQNYEKIYELMGE